MKDHERRIWKHIAFLGRYGHQPADVCLNMAVNDMTLLSSAVAGLLKDEADALKTD